MDPESHPSGSRFYRGLPITGSIILRLRVLEKETDALRFSLFFVLFIEGADPLKLPCVGLAPSEARLHCLAFSRQSEGRDGLGTCPFVTYCYSVGYKTVSSQP